MNIENRVVSFFKLLQPNSEKITFLAVPPKKSKLTNRIREYKPFDLKHSQDLGQTGYHVFYLPSYTGSKSAKNEAVENTSCVFIDVDENDLPKSFALPPSIITSRTDQKGHHIYWLLNEPLTDMKKWTSTQKLLIQFYKSDDSIHNPGRLMRVPYTLNHKYNPPQTYSIEKLTDTRYTLTQIILAHSDIKNRTLRVKKEFKKLFGGKKLKDGDGRHGKFIQAAFICRDYDLSQKQTLNGLRWLNENHLIDKYPEKALIDFAKSAKYGKNETGIKATGESLALAERIDRVKTLFEDWYFVATGGFYVDTKRLDKVFMKDAINTMFSNTTKTNSAISFINKYGLIKIAYQLIYEPKKKMLMRQEKDTLINIYQTPTLKPEKGDVDWFLEHIAYLFPAKSDQNHLLDFLAHSVQKPHERIRHALLIIGQQGIGKSLLFRLMRKILGPNAATVSNETVEEKFTGWLKNCHLVFVEEVSQTSKRDFYNRLKAIITEDTIQIREMYRAPYLNPNYANLIALSNQAAPIYLERGDRRWMILDQTYVEKQENSYYLELIKNIDEKAAFVFDFFLNRDLSKFHPGAAPPINSAKRHLINQSRSDLEVWVEEGIEDKQVPFDREILCLNDLINEDRLPVRFRQRTTVNRLARALRQYGCKPLNRVIKVDGSAKRYWAIRQINKWEKLEASRSLTSEIRNEIAERDQQPFQEGIH